MWGRPVSGGRHVLVNRDLSLEFTAFLAASDWEVALLQEVPPRWAGSLAEATGSHRVRTLTSRNWMRPLTFPLARVRPQLVGSWEGGSNLILVREDRRRGLDLAGRHSKTVSRLPERRTVTIVKLENGLCIANLHAGTGQRAADDVITAARFATDWAGTAPLVLAGDFNAGSRNDVFRRLETEFDLTGASAPDAIDHILTRGIQAAGTPVLWPPGRRDVPDERSDRLIRLSDHPPVSRRIRL